MATNTYSQHIPTKDDLKTLIRASPTLKTTDSTNQCNTTTSIATIMSRITTKSSKNEAEMTRKIEAETVYKIVTETVYKIVAVMGTNKMETHREPTDGRHRHRKDGNHRQEMDGSHIRNTGITETAMNRGTMTEIETKSHKNKIEIREDMAFNPTTAAAEANQIKSRETDTNHKRNKKTESTKHLPMTQRHTAKIEAHTTKADPIEADSKHGTREQTMAEDTTDRNPLQTITTKITKTDTSNPKDSKTSISDPKDTKITNEEVDTE